MEYVNVFTIYYNIAVVVIFLFLYSSWLKGILTKKRYWV